jgi:hypothetical protein
MNMMKNGIGDMYCFRIAVVLVNSVLAKGGDLDSLVAEKVAR